jgi:hypothetical protein
MSPHKQKLEGTRGGKNSVGPNKMFCNKKSIRKISLALNLPRKQIFVLKRRGKHVLRP